MFSGPIESVEKDAVDWVATVEAKYGPDEHNLRHYARFRAKEYEGGFNIIESYYGKVSQAGLHQP